MSIWKKIKARLQPPHPVTYDQDGLSTVHNTGFLQDPLFQRAEAAGAATGSWKNIHWRVHVVCWAARQCARLEGDFVECGTNRGGFARAICEYVDLAAAGKRFFLLDTFEGLDNSLLTEAEKKAGRDAHFAEHYADCFEAVQQTFAPFPFVKLIRGAVPGTLPQVDAEKIAFLSVDMNSVVPEQAALDYFWDKMTPGGMVLLDDFAYVTCDLQYQAHSRWAADRGLHILSLPTGQGLLIK